MTTEPKKARGRGKPKVSNSKTPPAYFLSLEVENILCFKDRRVLNLTDKNGNPAQWTVILGNNGVGKTTLLRCLAGMELREYLLESGNSYTYPILIEPYTFTSALMWLELLDSSRARIITKLVSGNNLSEIKKPERIKLQEHQVDLRIGSGYRSTAQELKGLICYGYGATRRMGQTSLSDGIPSEHTESLFSDEVSLINVEEWLLQTDYASKSASGQTQDRLKKQFNDIVEVLKRILPDVEDIHIAQVDEDHPRPRAEFKTPYGWVRLSSLGLGYRTMIAWMVDLAVRLFQRYPDSEDPLAEPAIVLVDEIDLHLHPKWQRTIMEFLTERFPNTQFIVTAHSPLVVQAAQNANIVLLRREGDRVVIDNNPEIIQNWRVDQVLTSVFELPSARPAAIEPLLDRRYEILSKAHLTEADEAELSQLDLQIGSLPTAQNPEDIKAMDIIRRAAKLLENSQGSIAE
ncbi:ATPase AAA-type core domain-containing protein [Tumidithrix helvetica PCC 7403]|uniref:AAA family ATPase n=1 Tax=Tumidithrix helvetica TaxID=3457545 RepID=UPI003C8C5397